MDPFRAQLESSFRPAGRLVRDRKTLELTASQQPGAGGYEPDRQHERERPLEQSVGIGHHRAKGDRKDLDADGSDARRQPEPAGRSEMGMAGRSRDQDQRCDAGDRKAGLRHRAMQQAGPEGAGVLWKAPDGNHENPREHDEECSGTPNADLFALGFFFVPGLLTIVLGIGLWFAVRGGQAWRAGALLVVLTGVFMVAVGSFPQDPSSFVAGLLHGTMAQTCFAIASVAPLVLVAGSASHTHLAPPRRLWLAAGIAAIGIEVLAIALRPVMSYPDGLFQRPFTLVLTIWFITTGAWLLRGRKFEGLSVPD